jgi:hypothetical protein
MEEEIGKTAGAIWDVLNTGVIAIWFSRASHPIAQREALFPNPLETRAGKGDGRLLG